MTTIRSTGQVIGQPELPFALDEEQLAAVAFLAATAAGPSRPTATHSGPCSGGRPHGLAVLAATRTHLELYRASMEERGLAASTIDRRLSTAAGSTDSPISRPHRFESGPVVSPPQGAPVWRRGLTAAS